MSRSLDIALSDIASTDRLRSLDSDWSTLLAESIKTIGLKQPSLVARSGEKYRLVAGLHRLAAFESLGRKTIPAEIVEGDRLHQRLVEIDENLMRRELSALDRGSFLAERQAIYLELHPETARGKAGAEARWNANATLSFASEVQDKLGISIRSIQRAIARMKIAGDVRAAIATTWIADHAATLDSLARLTPSEQRKVVKLMLRDKDPVKSVGAALGKKPASDKDQPLNALIALWKKTPASVKRAFVKAFDSEIAQLLDKGSR